MHLKAAGAKEDEGGREGRGRTGQTDRRVQNELSSFRDRARASTERTELTGGGGGGEEEEEKTEDRGGAAVVIALMQLLPYSEAQISLQYVS